VTYAGRPVVTYFFSSSGGYTENIENVWPGSSPEPWLRGVPDPYDGAGGNPYHRWGYAMSLNAAAAKLGSLVKGRLLGVAVTQHGVSPRVVRAAVVGSRGRTVVTGSALQAAFSLPSTYAAFTTITTTARGRKLSGSVYPGRSGTAYSVQALTARGWRTVSRHRLGARGSYSARLPALGRYRIQIGLLGGPAVSAHKVHAPRLSAAVEARRELEALLGLRRGAGPVLPLGRLARYAWPLAGHRRPLRPLPLLLRAP
jgi:hypothetical protein